MAPRNALVSLGLICLLCWASLIGLMIDRETRDSGADAIILLGSVKDVEEGQGSGSQIMTLATSSGDMRLGLPQDSPPPEIGRAIVVYCDPTSHRLAVQRWEPL